MPDNNTSFLNSVIDSIQQIRGDISLLQLNIERPAYTSGVYASKPTTSLRTGQRYEATDNGLDIFYNGTRWLTMGQLSSSIVLTTLTATTTLQFNLPRDYDLFIERLDLTVSQVNAGSGTNFWSWSLGTGMGISSGTVDTKLQGAGANVAYGYTAFTGNPLVLATNTLGRLVITFTQNNVGAGNLTLWSTLTYRKVG